MPADSEKIYSFDTNIAYNYKAMEESGKSNPEVTSLFIAFLVGKKYPQGLEGQLRRIWGRIQTKFDNAVEENASSVVELNKTELDFINKLFGDDVKIPAQDTKYFNVLEDALEALTG